MDNGANNSQLKARKRIQRDLGTDSVAGKWKLPKKVISKYWEYNGSLSLIRHSVVFYIHHLTVLFQWLC